MPFLVRLRSHADRPLPRPEQLLDDAAAPLAGLMPSDVVEQAGRAIARMPNVDADPESAVDYLVERSGVIREPVIGRIDFAHRTFQEYLAAKQAAEDLPASVLTSHAHLDQWRETVVMAAGHGSPSYRSALLAGLLERAEAEPRYARRMRRAVPTTGEKRGPHRRLAGDRALRHLPACLDGLSDRRSGPASPPAPAL